MYRTMARTNLVVYYDKEAKFVNGDITYASVFEKTIRNSNQDACVILISLCKKKIKMINKQNLSM